MRYLHDRLEQILDEMSSCLGMQKDFIFSLDREKKEVWLCTAHGINREGVNITYKPGFHKWPDNVWELESCIKQDVLLSKTNTIDCQHLPSSFQIAEKEIEK